MIPECIDDGDSDDDMVKSCIDPCIGKPTKGVKAENLCPGEQATHPSYFALKDTQCSAGTTTVAWTRPPQLKPDCANDDISYCTLVEVQNGDLLLGANDCKKFQSAKEMVTYSLPDVKCGNQVRVYCHDGAYPNENTVRYCVHVTLCALDAVRFREVHVAIQHVYCMLADCQH